MLRKYFRWIFFSQIFEAHFCGHGGMEFEKKIQSALETLKTSLEQHETQKSGYERTIARLHELQKSVPLDSKVGAPFQTD